MITIKNDGCKFEYKIDTAEKKAMNALSPKAFELAYISSDVDTLMHCIDKKYGKGSALKMFGMVIANMYTLEEIAQADKEINENE